MTLTVWEQSPLAVRNSPDWERHCIDPGQAFALIDLGDRIRTRIAAWEGRENLRIQQFVGVVRAGDLQLEILPKIESLPEPARVRQSLLAMLASTQDLKIRPSELAGFLESSEPFFRALARLYVDRLLEAVRRGLREDYFPQEDLLLCLRGKVHWPAQARLHAAGRLELPCTFDERSEDTPLNRTLKAGFRVAERMLEETGAAHLLELRHAMDGISDICPSANQRAHLQTDRRNRHLQPLLTLAKLLLKNHSPDFGHSVEGRPETYALVWDMNLLFEEYVGQIAKNVLQSQGFRVILQDETSYLAQETGTKKEVFGLRPDLLARRNQEPWIVADTKWKVLVPHSPHLGISGADVYQMIAYAYHHHTGQAVLIYPHHPALPKPPGLQREFLTKGPQPVRIRVVTLDLAQLELVPEQLQKGLLSDTSQG